MAQFFKTAFRALADYWLLSSCSVLLGVRAKTNLVPRCLRRPLFGSFFVFIWRIGRGGKSFFIRGHQQTFGDELQQKRGRRQKRLLFVEVGMFEDWGLATYYILHSTVCFKRWYLIEANVIIPFGTYKQRTARSRVTRFDKNLEIFGHILISLN